MRSDHGARLNNSHQMTTASPPRTPPRTASSPIGSENSSASGAIERHAEREQPLQHHDDHAGPQPERFARQSLWVSVVVIGIPAR